MIGFFAWLHKHICNKRTGMHAATYDPVVQFFVKLPVIREDLACIATTIPDINMTTKLVLV